MVTTRNTGCCAVGEIIGLSWDRRKTPIQALKDMFNGVIKYGNERSIHSFYTFTGVVDFNNEDDAHLDTTYGPKFAAFLEKNKLGKVSTITPELNRMNHPDHLVQIWVWRPDPEKLLALLRKKPVVKKRGAKVSKKK